MTKPKKAFFLAAKDGQLKRMMEEKMAAKKARKIRKAGDPLPSTVSSGRVLEALQQWSIKEKAFTQAYDETAKPRGRGAAPITAAQKGAIKSFLEGKLGRSEALEKSQVKTPGAFLNLVDRYHEEQ